MSANLCPQTRPQQSSGLQRLAILVAHPFAAREKSAGIDVRARRIFIRKPRTGDSSAQDMAFSERACDGGHVDFEAAVVGEGRVKSS